MKRKGGLIQFKGDCPPTNQNTSTPERDNTCSANTTSNREQDTPQIDEDTLANIPSLSDEFSSTTLTCNSKDGNDNNQQQLSTRRTMKKSTFAVPCKHMSTLSPGEIPKTWHPRTNNTDTQSFSEGEAVPFVNSGYHHQLGAAKPLNMETSTSDCSSPMFASSRNKVRGGIDVIDISLTKGRTVITRSGEKQQAHKKRRVKKITVSSEEPSSESTSSNSNNPHLYEMTDDKSLEHSVTNSLDPASEIQTKGPVMLLDTSDDKECDYSFTFSSLPLPS